MCACYVLKVLNIPYACYLNDIENIYRINIKDIERLAKLDLSKICTKKIIIIGRSPRQRGCTTERCIGKSRKGCFKIPNYRR